MSVFNIKWLVVAVVFTAAVVLFSHLPQEVTPSRLEAMDLDKLQHILAYGAMTVLFVLSLRRFPSLLSVALLFSAIIGVGAVDELSQPLVNRTASLADWLADVIGIIIALATFLCVSQSKRQASLNVDT